MRLLKLLILAALLMVAQQGYAQDCQDEISTDPRNPSNPDRPQMENTFFWFPHNDENHSTFRVLVPGPEDDTLLLNSPFWAETDLNVGQLAKDQNSDFYPEDGWELLKVNFGFLSDGTPRDTRPSMPYMILYNRYTGTMRFLGIWPNQSTSWNIIRFVISVRDRKMVNDQVSGALLDATNLLSVQGDAIQPLDQQTEETVYEVITEYPGISNYGYFYWFDLPVAYDPCICNNNVAITLQASVENQWDVTVKGALDAMIIQQGSSSSGNSKLITKRIIGAAGATVTAIATGGAVVDVGSFTGLIDIFSSRQGIDDETAGYLNLLKEAMNVAGSVAWNTETQEWRSTIDSTSMSKSDWKKLFSGIGSFINAGVDFANPTESATKPRTTVVGTITATGTATLNQLTGDLVYLGVPGSNWTDNLAETTEDTPNGRNPEYPTYNNPLGTFALLKTPTIQLKEKGTKQIFSHWRPNPNPHDNGSIAVFQKFQQFQIFFDAEEFLYTFNSSLDLNLEETEILASIVVKENNAQLYRRQFEPCGNLTDGSCYDNELSTYLQELDWHYGKNFYWGIDSTERITKPVPLSYLNEVVGEFMSAEENDSYEDFNYFIRFNISMIGNRIGRNGSHIHNDQVLTFPLNVEISSATQFDFYDLENGQNSSSFEDTTIFGNNQVIYNENYINISSSVSSAGTLPASILSSAVIHLTPGAHLNPKLRLAIDYPFQGLYPQQEVSSSYLSDFCANNLADVSYQANQFSPLAPQLPSPSAEFIEQYHKPQRVLNFIILSPNPATDQIWVNSSSKPITEIEIFDLSGRSLIHQKTDGAGLTRVVVNVASLQSGVYIVQAVCGDERSTQKLVISR